MKVYRVEHRTTKEGPYSGEFRVAGMGACHGGDSHPSPQQDTGPVRNWIIRHGGSPNAVHGFDSMEKLEKWFKDFGAELQSRGHVIRVFEVPLGSYRRGKQVVFWRNKSTLVDTVDVSVSM